MAAGKFSPLSLFFVVIGMTISGCQLRLFLSHFSSPALYLFRGVYSEVGSALPMNGGSYTVLLNTTNKTLASLAACLTLLSYVATAVVSGTILLY